MPATSSPFLFFAQKLHKTVFTGNLAAAHGFFLDNIAQKWENLRQQNRCSRLPVAGRHVMSPDQRQLIFYRAVKAENNHGN
jgi:hypothetical protein